MKSKSILSAQMSRCILLSETYHICIFCIKHKITLSLHSKINFLLQWFKFSTSTKCNFKISMLNFSAKVQIQINILSKVTSQIHSSLCTIFQSSSTLCKFLGDLTLTQCRILRVSGKLRCANILWVHSFRCTWLLTGVPNKKNKSYLFDETTFLGTSRNKLFPSEVLIVSNISLQCVLKLAENWKMQFQAEVTNQVFCNKVVFLASFQTRKVNIVQWHGLNSNDCKVWSTKWSYLAICTKSSFYGAYNNEKQPERGGLCSGLLFWKIADYHYERNKSAQLHGKNHSMRLKFEC